MTGYQETLTDPSYAGQIVTMTAAHIANTGVSPDDRETLRPRCAGLAVSAARASEPLEGLDLAAGVTRPEVHTWSSRQLGENRDASRLWRAPDLAPRTAGLERARKRVVVVDFGVMHNILRPLPSPGCPVTVMPAKTSADAAVALRSDGIFLSNDPGDPAAVSYAIDAVRAPIETRTVESIELTGRPAASVQHHPEASPGPRDAERLFHRFVEAVSHAA